MNKQEELLAQVLEEGDQEAFFSQVRTVGGVHPCVLCVRRAVLLCERQDRRLRHGNKIRYFRSACCGVSGG